MPILTTLEAGILPHSTNFDELTDGLQCQRRHERTSHVSADVGRNHGLTCQIINNFICETIFPLSIN
jgi:hypothetical protein